MKATIEFSGMIHMMKTFDGDSPKDIIDQLQRVQDLDCLIRMGPMYGDDTTELRYFMDKYYDGTLSWDDVEKFNIELSVGSFKCIDLQE